MTNLTKLEQLYYLRWFLTEQIKNNKKDLEEVEEEIKVLERKEKLCLIGKK